MINKNKLKDAFDTNIVFYRNSNYEDMIDYVFKDNHVDDDGVTFSNIEFKPVEIEIFSEEDYEHYENLGGSIPPNVKNAKMFLFTARNGNLYLGCFNGSM